MSGSNWKSVQRPMPKAGQSAALVALLALIAFGSAGCILPFLSIIPSVISLAHTVYKANNSPENDADAKDQEAQQPTVEASEPTSPAPKLTSENLCQMMAIARPDMVLIELRKNSAGAPEYRELRLLNSADEAHWTPIVGNDTGPNGWLPAVNFLKMDFKPPLIDAIPDIGSCYLAYAPIALAPNDPNKAAELKSGLGGAVDTFSWAGQVYQYAVGRMPPCLSPSS